MGTGSVVLEASAKSGAEAPVAGSSPAGASTTDEARARADRRHSYADGACFSLMVGFGETYLPAFALAVGRSDVSAGLLSTIPLLVGGVLQLVTPRLSRVVGSDRRWVAACAALQGLTYLPLAAFALLGEAPFPALFLLASLYWALGMAAGSVWNHWIDAIIPRSGLTSFFATRSRLTQLASFGAFISAGLWLHGAGSLGDATPFAALFGVAMLARFASTYFLARQTDAPSAAPAPKVPTGEILRSFLNPSTGRFLLYMLAVQVAINLGSPFFTPFMLSELKFGYLDYVAIVSAAYVSKIAFYPAITAIVRKLGAYRSLWVAGSLIAIPPPLWFLMPSLTALVILQVVAGFVWGVFELASTLLIFDRIKAEERVAVLSVYNLLNAAAVAVGSVIGGAILASGAAAETYPLIFTLSAAARVVALAALFRAATVGRVARGAVRRGATLKPIAFRIVALRPAAIDLPVLVARRRRRVKPKTSEPQDS